MNESFVTLMSLGLGAVLVSNVVLSQLLGVDTLLTGTTSVKKALATGGKVTLLLNFSTVFCWLLNQYLLVPNGLKYMETALFLLTTLFFTQLLNMLCKKPTDDKGLSLTVNSAVLGIVLQNAQNGSDFLTSLVYGIAAGVGLILAMVLFAGIRERLEFADCPRCFAGLPAALVAAGLVALCFTGFANLTVFG